MVVRKQLTLHKKMSTTPRIKPIEDRQALALHQVIAALMREFRLEPGLLAGSVYADLHANDIALFEVLSGPGDWNVRSVAQAISVPITTVSSALDRLERKGLITRFRIAEDRRVVRLGLTTQGRDLASSLEKAHIDNCRAILARLSAKNRKQFLDLAAKLTSE
jgi:DNA-binding MarR family transcriptional regulator